jgi:hypothetical protein
MRRSDRQHATEIERRAIDADPVAADASMTLAGVSSTAQYQGSQQPSGHDDLSRIAPGLRRVAHLLGLCANDGQLPCAASNTLLSIALSGSVANYAADSIRMDNLGTWRSLGKRYLVQS